MDHPVWRRFFGSEIDEGKASWRARKERLAQITGEAEKERLTQGEAERGLEPLSKLLDKMIDEITRLFAKMCIASPEPEDLDHIHHVEDGLAAIERDLSDCFTSLKTLKWWLGGRSRQ